MITQLAFIQNLSVSDLVLVACVILFFVGAKRLPGLIRSIGDSCREFKSASLESKRAADAREDR